MVNPEVTDPKSHIHFSLDGKMTSEDENFKYTIVEVCKLSRKDLNDQRRKIIEDFRNNLRAEMQLCQSADKQKDVIGIFIRNWINESKNELNTFLAFRRYIIEKKRLNQIIKEIIIS